MQFDIIGAGALGLLFGGKLASSGESVRFWTRTPEQAISLKQEGIRLDEPNGTSFNVEGNQFEAYYMEESGSIEIAKRADWLLLTTKQRHLDTKLLNSVGQLAGPETKVVCFQNGVGHMELIRSALPGVPVYAAITTEGAKRINEYSVVRAGHGTTQIGESGSSHDQVGYGESLVKMLETAGFTALLSKDIEREIYKKLLINAVINPLTALWRVANGQLLEKEERLLLLRQLCEEGTAIYNSNGIPCDNDMFDQIVAVCRATTTNISSMLKDVQQGTPTEIDYINGRLVEMAQTKGISAPGHEMVWRLVRAL
ncbi:2-dehydropantoate 2-reductase [Paenibacillus sp. DXFW5]|uniref:2-dehydropantoate 2-reductase n=1 Tax=Paenibacillus rhizolycopersici TaxID=2780073 RepID=A0ABS2H4T9_9BACL|nr:MULTISPECIES: 2-dehydropantoate 2-reductase [Paenibacillus]MBM6994866.1 2-dehydropantoate 2-reductase [Paenibacillus rhizolycopersici]GIP48182.1 2-dehydropantoate 2-reductase [Paenibacillus sp. J53TS2]